MKKLSLCIIMGLMMISCGGDNGGNPEYDTARANWGSTWRLPTFEEINELVDCCVCEWVAFDEDGTRAGWGNGRYVGRTIRPVSN